MSAFSKNEDTFDLNDIRYSISFPGSIFISLEESFGKEKQSLPSYFIEYSNILFVGFNKVIAFITESPKIHEN